MENNKLAQLLKTVVQEFEENSWLSFDEIETIQYQKLEKLAHYCAGQSKLFAKRLQQANLNPKTLATPQGLKQFPLLTRRDLQTSISDLYCQKLPAGHMPFAEVKTSGATGEPVIVRRTAANQVYFLALSLLEHQWHKRDHNRRLCAIRANIFSYQRQESWGQPLSLFFSTGSILGLPITTDAKLLAEWVLDFQPHYLLIYPSTLKAFTTYCQEHALKLPLLQQIRTISETLSKETRNNAQDFFNCTIADTYSSQELGVIAIECPHSGLYHIAASNLIVEVLNSAGKQCQPGEVGRVVATDLNNLATPLIRYDIGDYAQVGEPCSCGRGWPTLTKILGRERHLIIMPDGSRHWPVVGFLRFREIAPIVQYQFIQHERERIEVRLVTSRSLFVSEESTLREHIQSTLGFPFNIDFNYFDAALPVGQNGKFEEFICLVAI